MRFLLVILGCLISILTEAQTYYISNSGTGSGDGLTQATAWTPSQFLQNYNSSAAGDTFLLHCGENFYITIPSINVTSTVVISSYGTGDLPVVNHYTGIKSIGWVNQSANIWKVDLSVAANITGFTPKAANIGNVGFLLIDGVIWGGKKSDLSSLSTQWDFYSDGVSVLYVYSTSKPSNIATNINCTTSDQGMNLDDNMYIKKIAVRGFGGTGIRAIGKTNITIDSCNIWQGGGSYLGSGTTRYGAGISFDEGGTNLIVHGCHISQPYEACMTLQTHGSNSMSFTNAELYENVCDSSESSFCPSVNTGITNSPGFTNCRVHDNEFDNAGNGWSHTWRPKDNQAVCIYDDAWDTREDDLILENNHIYNPREGIYFMGGSYSDPRFTSRNNTICMSANILIRKNFNNASKPYTYKLIDAATFTLDEGYESGTSWNDILLSCPLTSPPVIQGVQNLDDFLP